MRPQHDAWPVMGEGVTRSGQKGWVRTGQAQPRATSVRSAGACSPWVGSPLHKLRGVHPTSLWMAAYVPRHGGEAEAAHGSTPTWLVASRGRVPLSLSLGKEAGEE